MILGNKQLMKPKGEIDYESGKYQLWAKGSGSAGWMQRSEDYGASWVYAGDLPAGSSYGYDRPKMSKTGQYILIKVNASTVGGTWLSTNYGANFTLLDAKIGTVSYSIQAYSLSANGKYMAVYFTSTTNYVSDDFGATWARGTNTGSSVKESIMSDDGKYRVVVNGGATPSISQDFGVTWGVGSGLGGTLFQSADMSNDGKYMLLCRTNSVLYRSTDYGSTFVSTGFSYNNGAWTSEDGNYIIATGTTPQTDYSADGGSSFSPTGLIIGTAHYRMRISESGQYMIAGGYDFFNKPASRFFVSGDFGATWSTGFGGEPAQPGWQDATMSSDGQYMLVAQGNSRYIWKSNDWGVTWVQYGGLTTSGNSEFVVIN